VVACSGVIRLLASRFRPHTRPHPPAFRPGHLLCCKSSRASRRPNLFRPYICRYNFLLPPNSRCPHCARCGSSSRSRRPPLPCDKDREVPSVSAASHTDRSPPPLRCTVSLFTSDAVQRRPRAQSSRVYCVRTLAIGAYGNRPVLHIFGVHPPPSLVNDAAEKFIRACLFEKTGPPLPDLLLALTILIIPSALLIHLRRA
jgi:hypothetical protein